MKKLILILTCIGLLLLVGCTQQESPVGEIETSQDICEQADGSWTELGSSCVDSCTSQRSGEDCMDAMTDGCDCGDDSCWNGQSCEPNSVEELETPQYICEQADGSWTELGSSCVDSCTSQRDGWSCMDAMTDGCDCGDDSCWNGQSCEPN
jgi:hypothetical protein